MTAPATPAFDRALVVANPHAGNRRRRLDAAQALALVQPLGGHAELGLTRGPGHARELAAGWAARGGDLVIAVGGDGTVHEAACGLVGTGCALAVLPSGSGNDFATGVGCGTVTEGLEAIARGTDRELDACALDDMVFVNSCGLLGSGLVSGAAAGLWRWLGPWRYTVAAAGVLTSYRGQDVRWRVDGALVQEGPHLLAEICNGPLTGGGFRFAPDARADDGLLDGALLRPLPLLTAFRLLPRAQSGERLDHPALGLVRGREIRLESAADVAYHLDGEPGVLPGGEHVLRVLEEKILVRMTP